jgi:hypothetical protein
MGERALVYGAGQLRMGRVRVRSQITGASAAFAYAVLHFGDQNVTAAVQPLLPGDEAALRALEEAASLAIGMGDIPEVIRLIDKRFGPERYSLSSLFGDEQRRILEHILQPTVENVTEKLASIYAAHASLFAFLSRTGVPIPTPLRVSAEFALDAQLRRALGRDPIDKAALQELMQRAQDGMVALDLHSLGVLTDRRMREAMRRLEQSPEDGRALQHALELAEAMRDLPFAPNLWQAQNIWYELVRHSLHGNRTHARGSSWREDFLLLGARLSFDVERVAAEPAETGQGTPALSGVHAG